MHGIKKKIKNPRNSGRRCTGARNWQDELQQGKRIQSLTFGQDKKKARGIKIEAIAAKVTRPFFPTNDAASLWSRD